MIYGEDWVKNISMASRSVNKVILLGHLGKDPETTYLQSGTAKSVFSVATNRRVKDRQTEEWRDETDWHTVVLWDSESLVNFLTTGRLIYVEGKLQTRSFEDRSGNKRYVTEVVADARSVILLDGGKKKEATESRPAASSDPLGITDDDVPF
jgi:single-strand DNA-binding protein